MKYNQDDKYVLYCTVDSHFAFDFVLYVYNPSEDAHEPALLFDLEDVPGLRSLFESTGQIDVAYALIDKYLKSKLGFVPNYEVI